MSETKSKSKILRHARFEDGKLVLPAKEKDIKPEKNENVVGKNLDYLFLRWPMIFHLTADAS